MPFLDVDDVLSDPDFQDSFQVISSTMTIGSSGAATVTPASPVTGYGVIEPDRTTLQRLDDGSRLAGSINIWTTYALTAGVKTNDVTSAPADIVVWRSRQYTVSAIEDWSNYGRGFIRAAADLLPLNPSS